MIRLKDLSLSDFQSFLTSLGEPPFRCKQIVKWLYQKRTGSFDQMTNVAKSTRDFLQEQCSVEKLPVTAIKISKHHDAVKFGFLLVDGECTESVLLVDGKRRTACISSQLGCGLGCTFCETARMGLVRNLTQEEILGQLVGINDFLAEHEEGGRVTNVVFMGMGEALSNFVNFRSALDIIMAEEGFNIGGRRITVSTAGVVPSIDKLIAENLNIGLAISLNSVYNVHRSSIMPINKKYPIEQLVDAARRYFDATGRRVTFEYVVVAGVTDTPQAIETMGKLLNGLTCKVNLIPVNPNKNSAVKAPSESALAKMAESLAERGVSATVRISRGQDISGACGQLYVEIKRKK